jgi:hypothetical protein
MSQIPILAGIYTDDRGDFHASLPVNLMPVPMENGISKGYLRPIDGIVQLGDGPGACRGACNWNGVLYRVMGTSLVSVNSAGVATVLGDVGGSGRCAFDYSFDRLAISSGGNLYYWNGSALTMVTDPDIGTVLDVVWVDGYFMTTDGTYLVTSQIGDPTAWSPLKYGSSEIDPDPINSVMKLRNEIYAVNRYTIEVFRNVGGSGFPFERITGAQIQKGSVGTWASAIFAETVAFVGGGRNETPSVYIGAKAQCTKISTADIDALLTGYSDTELAAIVLESRNNSGQNHLWLRLKDRTLVYDIDASAQLGQPVWFVMVSGLDGFQAYRCGDLVWCYNRWNVADPYGTEIGYLVNDKSSQWGEAARWEFGTTIVYNDGRGALFHSLELVCLTGNVQLGDDPTISTSYSTDGQTWSMDKSVRIGKQGERAKRIVWYQQGHMRNWRIQRFRGDSQAFLSITRLEAQMEPLAV